MITISSKIIYVQKLLDFPLNRHQAQKASDQSTVFVKYLLGSSGHVFSTKLLHSGCKFFAFHCYERKKRVLTLSTISKWQGG